RCTRSYLSRLQARCAGPSRVGGSTSVPLPQRGMVGGGTGCCGFTGPIPSATLDKIPTRLSETILGHGTIQGNDLLGIFLGSSRSLGGVCWSSAFRRSSLFVGVPPEGGPTAPKHRLKAELQRRSRRGRLPVATSSRSVPPPPAAASTAWHNSDPTSP